MAKGICSIEGCEQKARTRGWCNSHYKRWLRHGTPFGGGRRINGTPMDRFIAYHGHVSDDGCRRWRGTIGVHGYGEIRVERRAVPVHRWLWELIYGPIPRGIVLDHQCHNEAVARGECVGGASCLHRACHNLHHLRLVTPGENSWASPLFNGNATHCPQGHAYDYRNTYIAKDGRRKCRRCRAEGVRRRYQARAAIT